MPMTVDMSCTKLRWVPPRNLGQSFPRNLTNTEYVYAQQTSKVINMQGNVEFQTSSKTGKELKRMHLHTDIFPYKLQHTVFL